MNLRNKKDLAWILITSTLILMWGSIPTWAGFQAETERLRFRGLYFDSQDYAVHIAMMQAGAQGEWAYQFRFTTEAHSPAYVRMFYIALGWISTLLALAPESTFHLARWLLGFIALFALYKLMSRIFQEIFWARVAFLLAALGSGLGWLQLILNWTSSKITPIDFWLIDDYVFFSLSVFPHFAFVTAGMCIVLILWHDYLEKPHWSKIAWIAFTSILVQFANPIALATVDAGMVGAAIFSWWKTAKIKWTNLGALAWIAMAQMPLLVYNFVVLNNDPLWSQFTSQNQTLSPPPDYYLWGFGLFWLFAAFGTFAALREKSPAAGAAIFWIVSGFALAYAPVEIQRRFLQNITIPMGILSASGLMKLFETGTARNPRLTRWQSSLALLLVFLTSISSLQLSLGRALYLQTHPEDLYYPSSIDAAVDWLRANAEYNDFVLASEGTSQVLAQKSGMRVYMGHEMETLNYKTKKADVQSFFEGKLPQLANRPIKWVIFGPLERRISDGFEPPPNLEPVFTTEDLSIYLVK